MKKVFNTTKEKEENLKQIDLEINERLKEIENDGNTKLAKDKLIMYISLACSFVFMITYFISSMINSYNMVNQLDIIISTSIISLFTVLFIVTSLFLDKDKKRIFVIICGVILSIYFLFMLLIQNSIIKLPKQDVVLNFYGKDIKEVVKWAEENNILVEQIYENSDTYPMYQIINQNIEPGTLTKKIDKIIVVVSDGPNVDKETIIPDMKNWDIDKVIDFVEDNYLTNLTIDFEFNNQVEKDLVFFQENESDKMLRNSKIYLKASLGKKENLNSLAMKNLVGLDTFHATTWLGRNAINYEIIYGYSDKYDEGTVIKQSITKGKIIDKERTKTVTLTVAKKNEITVIDFSNMKASEITSWATDNKLKIEFEEEYDDSIDEGKVISSNKIKGDTVEIGDTIKITLSKGQIKMIKFTDVDSFRNWANQNDITYDIEYEFSNTVDNGKLIGSSHKENQVIKNTDNVKLVISQGSKTIVPDFIGKTKSEAETLCKDNHLKCEFIYSDNSDEDKDTIIKQSMKKGSNIPSNTEITLTLSSGK